MITTAGAQEQLSAAFRTEFFLKTGLVLMGATINFADILRIGAKGMVQAVVIVTAVFFLTWYLAGWFGLEAKLRALMAASVSIWGVSAAIAAAGAVLAKKEHLAYVATLVIVFALPLMLIQPYAAKSMDLSPDVAGAWIGGNIDTTAAVVGAGAIHSEAAMKVASVVKLSQNALIGFAAFFLALYWVVVIERQARPEARPPRNLDVIPEVRPGVPGRLIDHDVGHARTRSGHGRHRSPAQLVPDGGLRLHRPGTGVRGVCQGRLEAGGRVFSGHHRQHGARIGCCVGALRERAMRNVKCKMINWPTMVCIFNFEFFIGGRHGH